MGFLAPLYLLAAGAVAVPLLIHLLRRRIGTRVDFPAVRYLERAEREHSRKLRLRNLLLMALRVAAVLLVALAAARPVMRVRGSGHAPTALAIVLDNSLSTTVVVRGHPILDALRRRARDLARQATAEDRVWLVTADGAVRGGTPAAVADAIDRAEALGGAGDLPRAVERAAALVRQGSFQERGVAVLTDGQASAWRSTLTLGDVRLRLLTLGGTAPPNRGVVEAFATPARWTPRGAVHARILAPDSATYRITLEGRTLARGTAGRDEEVIVRATPQERGWTAGTVEIEPDELRGDDVRHFAVWLGPAPGVTVQPTAGPFVRSAVDALTQAERVTPGGDVVVTPADEATRLPAVLLAPSDPVRVGAANRALERLGVPWRLGAQRRGEALVRADSGPASLAGVGVSLRYALVRQPGDAADTVATVGGEPWVVRGAAYTLVGSPLAPEATSLPLRAAFVPWMGELLTQGFGADAGSAVAAAPGASVQRPRGAESLEAPGGGSVPLGDEPLTAPERPGVYFFVHAGRRVGALVVNPEPEESRLERAAPDRLRALFRAADVQVSSDSLAFAAALWSSSPRRSIVLPLLLAAVVALVGESLVAGAGRRREE